MLFVEWHPKGNVLITGGKDYMVWMLNGLSGEILGNFIGHEADVTNGLFTLWDNGKQVLSASEDKTLRLWSPLKAECLKTIRGNQFHQSPILVTTVHQSRPLCLSGDESGAVFACHYQTGEIAGCIGKHENSCESIVINSQLNIAVSAGIHQTMHIYDLKEMKIRQKVTPCQDGGFSKLLFS